MQSVFTPSLCHINLAALERNFHKLGRPEKLMPVIKADAYGHGLLPVAQTLSENGAQWFAVGTASEGALLREHGFRQGLTLLLGCVSDQDWQLAWEHDLIPLVGSISNLHHALAHKRTGRKLKIAVKCDSGMSRLGFNPDELPTLLSELKKNPQIEPAILVSHFSCADQPEEETFTSKQQEVFNKFYTALQADYPDILRSLGNSAATLRMEENSFDLWRPGYALYGGNPLAGCEWAVQGESLEWVMSVSAPILQLRQLVPGQSVSYGRRFTATQNMTIAIIACGYATGLGRAASGKGYMVVNGKRARQIGTICMGMTMIDVSSHDNLHPGDPVWLLGGPWQKEAISADEIAANAGTIGYEILCLMGSLNPRVYERDSAGVADNL